MEEQITMQQSPMEEKPQTPKKKIKHKGLIIAGSIVGGLVVLVLILYFVLTCNTQIHAWKKTDIKRIVNLKNIFQLFLTDAIILVLVGVFVQWIVLLTNTFAGLSVGIVLMEIAFIVIGLNAESYVKTIVKDTDCFRLAARL